MNEIINLLAGQTEEVSTGITWLSNDLKEVTELVELLKDSQALSENKSIHTMCCMVVEKLEKISSEDVLDINKSITKLNKSVNELVIETVNKRSSRSTKSTTKRGTRKTPDKKIVKIDDSVVDKKEQVVDSNVTAKVQ